VLWEAGLLPEVHLLPEPVRGVAGWPAASVEEAVALALDRVGVPGDPAARATVERRFDELFERDDAGFWPRQPGVREVLITWTRGDSPALPA
jgi:hypothetical protein